MPAANLEGFMHVFRADNAVNRPRRVTKRARQPVSCQLCRIRKLRCDREHPVCGSCVKRGDEDSCSYSSTTTTSCIAVSDPTGTVSSPKPNRVPRPHQMVQTRLQQLEQLVNELVANGRVPGVPRAVSTPESLPSTDNKVTTSSAEASPPHGPDPSTRTTGGHISRNGTETPYVGATHWTAILESIHDIRDCLEEADGELDDIPRPPGPRTAVNLDPLFGSHEPITIRAVMAALPTRLNADKLLGVYDKGQFASAPVLHAQQFRRQYESFWLFPASTSFLWISILFSTLAMAIQDDIPHVGEEAAFAQQRFYTTKAMQCLVAGEYLKAKPLAVEALVMYTLVRVSERNDVDPYLWSFFSVAVRLAQRMGYHRDATQIAPIAGVGSSRSRITPFQAEMRRRSWFLLEAFDLMYSMQLGLPTVIHDDQCDVEYPTNLHDEDFDEDSTVLPPARPDTEPTKALYITYKSRLVRQMRRITLHALSVRTREYEETLALHADLEAVHENIPPPLRLPNIHSIVAAVATDQTKTIHHRVALELMYLKALCILHRPYLARRETDPVYELSRKSARQAALKILEMHSEVVVEAKPSGKLFEKGYLISSLTLHDSLIAAMVLCLDLNETPDLSPEDRGAELLALRLAHSSWSSRASTSKDANHAKKVLGAMLRKVSNTAAAGEGDAPPSPILAGQRSVHPRRRQANRELPFLDHDYVSRPDPDPALARDIGNLSAPRVPAVLPQFLSLANEPLGGKHGGILSTMRYLDFSDVALEPLDLTGQDDLGSIIDRSNDIDWNMLDCYLLDRDRGIEQAAGDLVGH